MSENDDRTIPCPHCEQPLNVKEALKEKEVIRRTGLPLLPDHLREAHQDEIKRWVARHRTNALLLVRLASDPALTVENQKMLGDLALDEQCRADDIERWNVVQ